MTLTEWGALTGVVTGVTGTALGVISAINMLSRNCVKLRVIPKAAWKLANGLVISTHRRPRAELGPPNRLAIEIINLSAFPVTISEVGLGCPEPVSGDRPVLFLPELSPGFAWPPVLESRRSVTVYSRLPQPNVRPFERRVYVETECGKVKYGRSEALDLLAQHCA